MEFFGLSAVILLGFTVKNVYSICPESGCECGEFCVNNNSRWCNNFNDTACSCKKGCLVYDQIMEVGESKTIYCAECSCPKEHTVGNAMCYGVEEFCLPDGLTLNVDYPASENESPNCKTTHNSTDYEYYTDITTGIILLYHDISKKII
ncbi:hypothetical protein ACJMK2_022702 [Sinanodonta woodiana]|uniref:Uncharacterized protein n=1 Tax=Sinanodonta woodiana TaxID=1069815 RepID=A0ABD3TLX9_SINWO